MKPICVPCRRFFRPLKNGTAFVEGMPRESRTKRGRAEPQHWSPYKLWSGDLWGCPDCGAEVIVGVGLQPIAEHYEPDFAAAIERHKPEVQVNDC